MVGQSLKSLTSSETTGTLLAGAFYLLMSNRNAYEKLTAEIRSTFHNESDITYRKVDGLPYLEAVVKESLRMYPPSPSGLDRIVCDPMGIIVAGHWLPPGVSMQA